MTTTPTAPEFTVFQNHKGKFQVHNRRRGLVNGRRFKTEANAQVFADRCERVLAPKTTTNEPAQASA